MTGFEPGSSGIGSDRAINCATTTARKLLPVAIKRSNQVLKLYLFLPQTVRWPIFISYCLQISDLLLAS